MGFAQVFRARTQFSAALLAIGLASATVGHAQSLGAIGQKGFSCAFPEGHSWSYGLTGFSAGQPVHLTFSIDEIDDAKETAILTSERSRAPLKIVRALDALHFIEVTVAGFLNITTIYERDSDDPAEWPAVHSRHLGIVGQPLVSQFRGSCRPVSS